MSDQLEAEERQDACPVCGWKAVVLWRLDGEAAFLECDRCGWFSDAAQHNARPDEAVEAQHFDGYGTADE